jgi:hypothetical protein
MSAEKEGATKRENDLQRDLLKLFAYASLANLWTSLAAMDPLPEAEAKALLRVQEVVIQQFEKTLTRHLDFPSLKEFQEYFTRYKARI